MRTREAALMLGGMVAMFTTGGRARIHKCTINRLCRTQLFEFFGAVLDEDASPVPHVIFQTTSFRVTIVSDPCVFLKQSEFSPHYSASYSLRKEVQDVLARIKKQSKGHVDRLFLVIEEYKTIQPTDMHNGECLVLDEGVMKGGTKGRDAILALRSADGAWPDESTDTVLENIVLAAVKAEQDIAYGVKALADHLNFLECNGSIVHIQEGYGDFKFGALRANRRMDDDKVRLKAERIRAGIEVMRRKSGVPALSELITALRLQDSDDKKYLCLWYLRLWEAASAASSDIGERQFGNPEGTNGDRGSRREQLEHRNDIAHGRADEIDYRAFDSLQRDVLKLLRENVLR